MYMIIRKGPLSYYYGDACRTYETVGPIGRKGDSLNSGGPNPKSKVGESLRKGQHDRGNRTESL